jgi:hypothetical protein
MNFAKSYIHKSLACVLLLTVFFLPSCQDSTQNSNAAKADSAAAQGADTSYNGLEGTRDQQGALSTDVKVDTSSGQSVHTNQNKKVDSSK